MTTGVPGDQARQFAWQCDHYFVRGGANDPVIPVTQALGVIPSSGGAFSWNSVWQAPPVAGQSANRNMSINLSGTNTGGIFIGTIPQGAWIESIQLYVYTAFAGGGASQSIGIGYIRQDADLTYPTAFTGVLAAINGSAGGTGPLAGLYGGERPTSTPSTGDGYATATLGAWQLGPGNGVTASALQLASLGDINLYAFTGGTMTGTLGTISVPTAAAFTSGSAAVRVSFTGLPG